MLESQKAQVMFDAYNRVCNQLNDRASCHDRLMSMIDHRTAWFNAKLAFEKIEAAESEAQNA